MKEENSHKTIIFFSTFTKIERDYIQENYYEDLEKIYINIPFFTWFEIYKSNQLSTINRTTNQWIK